MASYTDVRYDLEPPPFMLESGSVLSEPVLKTSRCKNPCRAVSNQFAEPVRLAVRLSDQVLGHYNAGTGLFWAQTAKCGQALPPAAVDCMTSPSEEVTFPLGAHCGPSEMVITPDTCFEFYDFSLPAAVPDMLAVSCKDRFPPDVGNLAEFVSWQAVGFPDGWVACPQFLARNVDSGWSVHYMTVSRPRSPEVAHRLCAMDCLASPAIAVGDSVRKLRVQASVLRWVKDAEVNHALSKFADSMPGMAQNLSSAGASTLTWDDVVYDTDANVPRSMMSWGAFAAWLAKDRPSGLHAVPDLDMVCEPLASYIRAVLGIQGMRNGAVGAAAAVVDTKPLLQYNSPQKMSPEQCAHGAALFYWCAIHRDDDTRAMPKITCKRSLELYLRFGYVFLRKRVYHFHSGKRRRGEEVDE